MCCSPLYFLLFLFLLSGQRSKKETGARSGTRDRLLQAILLNCEKLLNKKINLESFLFSKFPFFVKSSKAKSKNVVHMSVCLFVHLINRDETIHAKSTLTWAKRATAGRPTIGSEGKTTLLKCSLRSIWRKKETWKKRKLSKLIFLLSNFSFCFARFAHITKNETSKKESFLNWSFH